MPESDPIPREKRDGETDIALEHVSFAAEEIEGHIAQLLATSPVGALISDTDHRLLYRNSEITNILALPDSLSVGADIRVLFGGPQCDALSLAAGDRRELKLNAADGRQVWVVVEKEEIMLAARPAIVWWLFDITDSKLVEQDLDISQKRLGLAIAGTQSVIWEADMVTGDNWWSPQFFHMLGYDQPPEKITENYWLQHLHPEDKETVENRVLQHMRGEDTMYDATYRMVRLDGSVIWVEARGSVSRDNGVPHKFNGLMTDVTVRKQAEQELLAAKDHAEETLGELRQAQRELIRAERMAALGSLVAGVSHEINTPLGNALTATSHLADETLAFDRKFQSGAIRKSDMTGFLALYKETTRLMMSNLERAVELIQSFKRVAVDQTSGERRTFDLAQYLEEILLSLRPVLRKTSHQVHVECQKDLIIDGYPGALSQIITNFVMNSLLHAFPEGQVGTIHIDAGQVEDGVVFLRYRDDGCGMPKDVMTQAFDPFFTTKRGAGGSGLGLHVVYNLATVALGGSILLETECGGGCEFLVRFPQVASAEGPFSG